MSNGLIAMYTEAAIQAGLAPTQQVAVLRDAGPNLRGDFNRLGLAMARPAKHRGHDALAVRALGHALPRSVPSSPPVSRRGSQRARQQLSDRDIDAMLATGSVSEPTELYRELWAVLEPLTD